jgi:hypothetical protein
MEWPRHLAAGNIEARVALVRCLNRVFVEHGIKPITMEEIERSRKGGQV